MRDAALGRIVAEWHTSRKTWYNLLKDTGIPEEKGEMTIGADVIFRDLMPYGVMLGTDRGWPTDPSAKILVIVSPKEE